MRGYLFVAVLVVTMWASSARADQIDDLMKKGEHGAIVLPGEPRMSNEVVYANRVYTNRYTLLDVPSTSPQFKNKGKKALLDKTSLKVLKEMVCSPGIWRYAVEQTVTFRTETYSSDNKLMSVVQITMLDCPPITKFPSIEQLSNLETGVSKDFVKALLGLPQRIEVKKCGTAADKLWDCQIWTYADPKRKPGSGEGVLFVYFNNETPDGQWVVNNWTTGQ